MRNEIVATALEIKATTPESGEFSGYGAVFGNIDQNGDVILPGAFRDTLAERKSAGRALPMHINHGIPSLGGVRGVGSWRVVEEDSRGVYVEGKLSGMNTDIGRYRYEQVRDGGLGGLSIGFNVKPNGAQLNLKSAGGPRRTIKALNLHEISLVDDPCNEQARVNQIKHALGIGQTLGERIRVGDEIKIREVEEELREKLGLSRSQAEGAAPSVLERLLARESAEGKAVEHEAQAVRAALAGFSLPSFR
jgi:HK97 family phage prohead protease